MDKRVLEMAAALGRLEKKHGTLKMELGFSEVVTLIAQVQLALRHPGNKGQSAAAVRKMITSMIDVMGQSEPRVAELLRLGFDPAQDEGGG